MLPLKRKIKQAFGEASVSYDSVARLQRDVGKALLSKIDEGEVFGTVVDVGCGTGFLIHELLQGRSCRTERIVALDIALPMLRTARKKLIEHERVDYLCADLEALPLLSGEADLVVSNVAYQWSGNLGSAFAEVKRVLKPNGRFLFTTFGSATLCELKEAWRKADDYAHVNHFFDRAQIGSLLETAGFHSVQLKSERVLSYYDSVWALMTELKSLGAGTVVAGGNRHLTGKSAMKRMVCAYPRRQSDGWVPATFEIITVSAQK